MLWLNFFSDKYDCFCDPAAWFTEAQEKTWRERKHRCEGKSKNWDDITNPFDKFGLEEAQVFL